MRSEISPSENGEAVMMKKKLYLTASFFNGASSIVNLFGSDSGYRYNPNGYEKDAKALGSDWEKAGKTIRKSMNEHSRKNKKFKAAR